MTHDYTVTTNGDRVAVRCSCGWKELLGARPPLRKVCQAANRHRREVSLAYQQARKTLNKERQCD